MRRSGSVLAVICALLFLSVGSLVILVTESACATRLENLGYDGPAVYIAAVGSGGKVPSGFGEQVREFAVAHGLSVAYSPAGSGMVTLFDPEIRVGAGPHAVYPALEQVSARVRKGDSDLEPPAALLSSSVRGLDEVTSASGIPVGFERFDPRGITFRGERLTAVVNVAAQPFSHGYYLFLGAADPAPILSMLTTGGMDILQVDRPTSFHASITSPFGVVASLALLSLSASAAITAAIRALLARPRLKVMATIGAPRRRMASEVVAKTLPPIAIGSALGAAIMVLGQLAATGLALSTGAAQARALVTTLVLVVPGWVGIVGAVVWLQVRWCRCAQPC